MSSPRPRLHPARLVLAALALAALPACPPEKEPGTGGSGPEQPSKACNDCLNGCDASGNANMSCINQCRQSPACKGQ